jgi:hypothetical protein
VQRIQARALFIGVEPRRAQGDDLARRPALRRGDDEHAVEIAQQDGLHQRYRTERSAGYSATKRSRASR